MSVDPLGMGDTFFASLPLRAQRVSLRQLEPSDLPAFLDYRSDPAVARYQGWAPMGEVLARAFLQEESVRPRRLLPGHWHQLGIARDGDAAGSLLVGDVGLWLSPDGEEAEFGISLSARQQGQGYALEALQALMPLLAETTSVGTLKARTDPRNQACLRLLERLGMQHMGRRSEMYKGEACIDELFELQLRRT